ncbi:hypothetical protein [Amycolatopsis sp. H20-H5]|uniref:hypothetical protein n=1 Tax=Amycolatopsis sp. H20-H5 TaxID=3046309 RepID=UPI002DB5E231|nr:hypothetical protein [Amycolatopsis sp. H20-H5]MEC3980701.1 hypothetical protein [Amycolatopsis sp. H20-H5]
MRLSQLVAAGVAATAVTLALSVPAAAAPAPEPLPTFDFADCPALPATADPGTWRCEAFVSQGSLTFGRVGKMELGEIRLTFAEGRINGQYAQVFGALRHEPARIPGLPGATLRLRYGGYSDFLSDDRRRGELGFYAELRHPLLPKGCAIANPADPVVAVVHDEGTPTVVSDNPKTIKFSVYDEDLALPAARGCGPLAPLLNHWLGLPSPSGTVRFEEHTYVRYQQY